MRQRLDLRYNADGRIWRYNNLASANRRHTHVELELNLVTRGRAIYLLGERRYQIRPGDLLWLFPAQEHVLIEQTPDFHMWVGVFRRRMIRRLAVDEHTNILLQNNCAQETCRRLNRRDLQSLDRLFSSFADTSDMSLLNAGLAFALLSAWSYFEKAADIPVHDVHPAVERASRLIRDGADSNNLAGIARQAGLSPTRLSRLFHEQTGFTLVDFRNRQRLERFFELYGAGRRRTMLDAALEAGFGSYPQFHRVFTRIVGCSPRAYRRQTP